MPTANGDTLTYSGVADQLMPDTTPTAWGCRLIVSQDGYVDFVHDRQAAAGVDRAQFLDLLNARFDLTALRDKIRDLLRTGRMQTRAAEDFVLYQDDDLEVHANTNRSAGYCYVAAWRKP